MRRSRFATCCTRPFNRGSGSCGPRPVWCRLRPPSVFPCLPANLQGDHLRRAAGRAAASVHGPDQVQAVHGSLLPLRGALAAHPSQRAPRAKSAMSCGVAVSKPTTSSMPGSFGSAMVKPFETVSDDDKPRVDPSAAVVARAPGPGGRRRPTSRCRCRSRTCRSRARAPARRASAARSPCRRTAGRHRPDGVVEPLPRADRERGDAVERPRSSGPAFQPRLPARSRPTRTASRSPP